jgi:hypothetical protein
MSQSKPPITGTIHRLPFDRLSPAEFERLCLWLVEREGYERVEHLGSAGNDQGRDIVAWCADELWAFQCKRVQRFGPKAGLEEVEKVLGLPEKDRPVGLVFLVTCDVSAKTRWQARARCVGKMECDFWCGAELDMKVSRHPDIVARFFGLINTLAALRRAFPESERAFEQLMKVLSELIEYHEVLQEWKDLHHQLQTHLVTLRPFMTEVELACNEVQLWSERRGKQWWSPCRIQLGKLKSFAQRVKHISAAAFYEDEDVLRGDPWVVEVVRAEQDVERLLDGHDLEELYDRVLHLFETCEIYLSFADSEIQHIAGSISAILYGALGSIHQ